MEYYTTKKKDSNNTCDDKDDSHRFSVMSKTSGKRGRAVWLHSYEIQGQAKLIYDDKVRLGDMDFKDGHEGIFWRDGHILSWFGWWIHRYIHA